ncbi:MAG: hypothetical protein IT367_12690 [Candidatus Hydrogenedentes bacterium]|nr:hypothetical protein [Candidatus Hydrogenedentota bacterium]
MPTQAEEPSARTAQSGGIRSTRDLIRAIKGDDEEARAAAWQCAENFGTAAVKPLADLTRDKQPEVARAATRGLWRIVRHCSRPGADTERRAVNKALTSLLSPKKHTQFTRDVLWMLSEIGDDRSVKPIAALSANEILREDACLALERIPGDASVNALREIFDAAPDAFKPNVAESLRRRGVEIAGVPSAKKTPSKSTAVKPM